MPVPGTPWRVVSVVSLGTMLLVLNTTTLNVALPVVVAHFGAGAFAASWLVPRLPRFLAAHPQLQISLQSQAALVDFQRDTAIDVERGTSEVRREPQAVGRAPVLGGERRKQ